MEPEMNLNYPMKTEPMDHQLEDLERSADLEGFGYFWQMGCGKSKTATDNAAYLFNAGKIDGLAILSPATVASNWIEKELPKHCAVDWYGLEWLSRRANTKDQLWESARIIDAPSGPGAKTLPVLAMGYEASMTTIGKKTLKEFLAKRTAMIVIDESAKIKTPSAKRTTSLVGRSTRSGIIHAAKYRRILSGTPITKRPFDVYSQVRALDPTFWVRRGMASFAAFRNRYGVWRTVIYGGKSVPELVSYRNLGELVEIIRSLSSRRLKADCLDLPEMTYVRRYFDLSREQAKIYKDVKSGSGDDYDMSIPIAATRMLRLQQIASGFYTRTDGSIETIPGSKPRIGTLLDVVDEAEDQRVIVWAAFRADVDAICAAFDDQNQRRRNDPLKKQIRYLRADGTVRPDERSARARTFQEGDHDAIVSTTDALGEGVDLTAATVSIYYSHGHRYDLRVQSESRPHRYGQHNSVTNVDLQANGTIDDPILDALLVKHVDASTVLGDPEREKQWLR